MTTNSCLDAYAPGWSAKATAVIGLLRKLPGPQPISVQNGAGTQSSSTAQVFISVLQQNLAVTDPVRCSSIVQFYDMGTLYRLATVATMTYNNLLLTGQIQATGATAPSTTSSTSTRPRTTSSSSPSPAAPADLTVVPLEEPWYTTTPAIIALSVGGGLLLFGIGAAVMKKKGRRR